MLESESLHSNRNRSRNLAGKPCMIVLHLKNVSTELKIQRKTKNKTCASHFVSYSRCGLNPFFSRKWRIHHKNNFSKSESNHSTLYPKYRSLSFLLWNCTLLTLFSCRKKMKNFQTSFEFFSLFGGAVILFFRFGIDGLLILIPLMIFVNTFKQAERNKLAPVNYDKPNKDLVVTLPLVVQTKDHVDVVVEPCNKAIKYLQLN